MASYHCSIKPVSRGNGRSSTAAAAYRAGVCIADERTGEVHDYTRKKGVDYTELVLPEGVSFNREQLWNAAENAEKRKDARVAREFELALPAELTPKQRRELATNFAKNLVDRYGVAADVAIHEPSRKGDQRNHHAHILITTRKISVQGLGEKTDLEREDKALRAQGKPSCRKQIEALRADWATRCNRTLERAGHEARVSHKSLEAQGINREPTSHLGPVATAMERRGIQTERGNLNRAKTVQEQQAERKELASLERQQQGIHAARQRFHMEKAARAAAKAEAEEKERQRKQQEAERARRRQAEREALEKQYGQAVCMLVCPQSLSAARSRTEYGRYLDRLQAATPEQRAAMEKELRHAEQRYGAQELFYSWAKLVSRDTSISGRERVRDTMLKEWDRATPERREQMEQEAREYVRTHERQRSGMSMGR
ncbi:MobQ family relaxase [Sangeribacter muris]|jgi:hypothetical protein|uniref:MobQ family relaxase n=1 Tax=Sangeribacter muris TaxID=2880703 RepID=UPI00244E1939|nr:MobQ family relaxase [Sangeribacter muris]